MRRILSIDGGGIKGVFPAAFLADLEEKLDRPMADYFDLIAGTSTGGIIALGLGLGFTAREILSFYEQYGPRIFQGHKSLYRAVKQFLNGKYDSEPLADALRATFGEKRLGESTKRLLIPSMDLQSGKPYIYKTAHHHRLENDFRYPVVDVALATSSAPTYFPLHRSIAGVDLVDGGVYANNPTGMAVVEAIGMLGWERSELVVLSLGCTSTPFSINRSRRLLGMRHWIRPGLDLFMRGQSHASLGTAYVLLDHQRVIRVCPEVEAKLFNLDNVKAIEQLKGRGHCEARNELPQLKEMFFSAPADAFEPYHTLAQR